MLDFNLVPHMYDMQSCVLIVNILGEKMYFYESPSAKALENMGYKCIAKCDGYLLYFHESRKERRFVREEA